MAAVTGQVEAYGDEPPEYRFTQADSVAADVGLGVQRELLVHGWDLADHGPRLAGHPPAGIADLVRVDPVLP